MQDESRTSNTGRRLGVVPALALALLACSSPDSNRGAPRAPRAGGAPAPELRRPNLVLVLADDMGWSDVGYNGAEFYETPNIDAFARAGMVFDRAYASGPNCSPMRASLLTGTWPPRHQIYTPGGRSRGPGRYMRLAVPRMDSEPLGLVSRDRLDPSFVSLAQVLSSAGYRTARFGKWHLGPHDGGFDASSLSGRPDIDGPQFQNPDSSRMLAEAGIAFMRENRDRPFFLFLSLWDPHLPLAADADVVARYEAKLAEQPGPWDPTYAAMIEAIDRCLADVWRGVDELGLADRTLLVFASDNGGQSWLTPSDPLRSGKGSLFEGGIRVPTCMVWPGRIAPGTRCAVPTSSVDYLPTFAELAGVALTPELLGDQPVDGDSLLPLIDEPVGRAATALAERDLFWFFPHYLYGTGNNRQFPIHGTDVMYWRGVPAATIMRGRWKLTRTFEDGALTLHDLERDVGEEHDVAAEQPELTRELAAELDAWIERTSAPVPRAPNPGFRPPGPGEEIVPGSPRAVAGS